MDNGADEIGLAGKRGSSCGDLRLREGAPNVYGKVTRLLVCARRSGTRTPNRGRQMKTAV